MTKKLVSSHSLTGEVFVFTGKIASIARKDAMKEVIKRGGECSENVTKKTTFVVTGLESLEHFIYKTKSTKLNKAENYIKAGIPMTIINEQEFLLLLKEC